MEVPKTFLDELADLANRFVREGISLSEASELWRNAMIHAALKQSGSAGREQNQCKAAFMLGIHRNTLNRRRL
jgi:transcriptional regulator with PAS, ATPase and Fis domain